MSEPTTDRPTFDPRFDPAFQPGYEPSQVSDQPPRVHVSAAPPVAEGVTQPEKTAPEKTAPEDAAASPVSAEQSLATVVAPPPSLARNPFVIALWIVSVVLVGAGIGLVRFSLGIFNNNENGGTVANYQLLQFAFWGAPMIIVLGLATAISTLFLFAARSIRSDSAGTSG